jgi:hypothetical protein
MIATSRTTMAAEAAADTSCLTIFDGGFLLRS